MGGLEEMRWDEDGAEVRRLTADCLLRILGADVILVRRVEVVGKGRFLALWKSCGGGGGFCLAATSFMCRRYRPVRKHHPNHPMHPHHRKPREMTVPKKASETSGGGVNGGAEGGGVNGAVESSSSTMLMGGYGGGGFRKVTR